MAFLHVGLTLALSRGNHFPSVGLSLLVNELDQWHHGTRFCRKCFKTDKFPHFPEIPVPVWVLFGFLYFQAHPDQLA